MSSRYPLNLPSDLKRDATILAKKQGVSLNQFFLWSISEKVSELKSSLDDPDYPTISYRRGMSGAPAPVIAGTGIRVQTIVVSHKRWGESIKEIAVDYGISVDQVQEALDFYEAHKAEIDSMIFIEREIERKNDQNQTTS